MFTPATTTVRSRGRTSWMRPRFPRSLPAITTTSSPLRIRIVAIALQDLRCQRHDLPEVALAKLARDRTEDPGPARLVLRVEQHRGVVVETDHRSVAAAVLLGLTDHHRADDLALLHARVRDGVLDGGDEHVADLGGRPRRRAQHADHRELTSSGVVRAAHSRVGTNHSSARASVSSFSSRSGARISPEPSAASSSLSTSATRGAAAPASPAREITSTSRQRFVALNGRLSCIRTRSPACASGVATGAAKRLRVRITFLYRGCSRSRPTSTMTVFAIFAETTTPTLVLRRSRRQVKASGAPPAGTAVRFLATVRRPIGRAAPAALAGALIARAATFGGAFVARPALAGVFFSVFSVFSVFSAIRRLRLAFPTLAPHRQQPGDLPARLRQRSEVLELARGELELRVHQLFLRRAQLIRELLVRQPPHVLHPPPPPLSP